MNIAIHIYFNLSKMLYSGIYRRDFKFLATEFAGCLILIFFALFFDSFLHDSIVDSSISSGISYFIYAIIYGFFFLISALTSRLIFGKNPIETSDIKNNNQKISVGIIDFSWLSMMAVVYAGILFCQEFEILSSQLKIGGNLEYYKLFYSETQYLFNETINIILVLGTILAACMTIIWGGQIWRKSSDKKRKQYQGTTIASIKMVIAFLIIVASVVIWISIPLYNKLSTIKDYIFTLPNIR